jgi:hypothetical protein
MEEKNIKITIRQNNATQFDITISSKALVKELKEACANQAGMTAEEQRLIFKGMRELG